MKNDAEAREAFLRHSRWAGQDGDEKWLRMLLREAMTAGLARLHREMRRVFWRAAKKKGDA